MNKELAYAAACGALVVAWGIFTATCWWYAVTG